MSYAEALVSESDIKILERFILQELRRLQEVAPDTLLEHASASDEVRGFSPGIVTSVIWNLVGRGEVKWTPNDKLSLAA